MQQPPNVSASVATITAMEDTQAALESLAKLCNEAYRDLKSVPTMIAVAWEAIAFALRRAAESPDMESARNYKSRARAIAYNAGANCWPGWGDAVEINSADIAEGLRLAERCHELVEELDLGDKARGSALWLIGALQMALGRSSEAIVHFVRAEEAFRTAQLAPQVAMAQGYAALASKSVESLATVLQSLREMESQEAHFFAAQLITADRIFSSRRNV